MNIGKTLIVAGVVLVVAGTLFQLSGRLPFKLGRLPGDIAVTGKNGSFYFPVVTCVVLSVLFTLVSWLFSKR